MFGHLITWREFNLTCFFLMQEIYQGQSLWVTSPDSHKTSVKHTFELLFQIIQWIFNTNLDATALKLPLGDGACNVLLYREIVQKPLLIHVHFTSPDLCLHCVHAFHEATWIDFNVYILSVHAFPGNQTHDLTAPILSDSTDHLCLVLIGEGKISVF